MPSPFSSWKRSLPIATLFLLLAFQAHASVSILIWPVDPVIEHDERATALWLENRGDKPAQMQLRVFAWRQADGENVYETQSGIVGSPPMIRIAPGQKQLIRLTRTLDLPAGAERAYRVVVDEIPIPDPAGESEKASVGIKFQMRYSIPLFVYGEGIWTKERHDRKRGPSTAAQPVLSWRAVTHAGRPFVEIRNTGPVHARLTEVAFRHGGGTMRVADGLLGYVLPGSSARWPLPEGVSARGELIAKINGNPSQQAIGPSQASLP